MSVRVFDRRTPALEMCRRRRAWKVRDGLYRVISRNGVTRYPVTVDEDGLTHCPCPGATFHGGACWHQVKVLQRILREIQRSAA